MFFGPMPHAYLPHKPIHIIHLNSTLIARRETSCDPLKSLDPQFVRVVSKEFKGLPLSQSSLTIAKGFEKKKRTLMWVG